MDVKQLFSTKIDRRRMLGNLGMMGAGAVITACGAAVAKPPQDTDYDAAILNFALNLEYLEAAFYLAVVGGLSRLPGTGDVVLPAGVDGNVDNSASFSADVRAYALELAEEELAHVVFLRKALSDAGAAVAERPTLDLSTSFVAAADAAFTIAGIPEAQRPFPASAFNPFTNEAFFLHGAFIFEDVGVTAYKGAAKYVTNPAYLEAAAGILAAEAYHAGTIRTSLYAAAEAKTYGDLPIFAIVKAISDARDTLDGAGDDDQPIGSANVDGDIATAAGANTSLTDANGIAFSRTPLQVAKIVYLSAEAKAGGFFPNGITIPADLKADFDFLFSL